MNTQEFTALIDEMTLAAEAADGERFARCFTEDAIYYDYIYGAHQGRKDIAHMLQDFRFGQVRLSQKAGGVTNMQNADAIVDVPPEYWQPGVLNGP